MDKLGTIIFLLPPKPLGLFILIKTLPSERIYSSDLFVEVKKILKTVFQKPPDDVRCI